MKEMTLFGKYDKILTYGVYSIMIALYYQVKTLSNTIY